MERDWVDGNCSGYSSILVPPRLDCGAAWKLSPPTGGAVGVGCPRAQRREVGSRRKSFSAEPEDVDCKMTQIFKNVFVRQFPLFFHQEA